jgi:hypothetical protein
MSVMFLLCSSATMGSAAGRSVVLVGEDGWHRASGHVLLVVKIIVVTIRIISIETCNYFFP